MKRVLVGLVGLVSLLSAREAQAACGGRPTDTGGYAGYDYGVAEMGSFATTKVRVHYAKSGLHAPALATTRADGVPLTVAYAAETAEDALTKYAAMGYRTIPSDAACPSNGGDEKVDIYLVKFNGADGSTVAECNGGSCSSFALVEATFQGRAYADAAEGFRTVVSHELFHAVQNTYKPADAPFWAEGTAQWAMKKLHPELQDFERALPAFFVDPARSIDAPPMGVTAGFLYGSAVWPLFLSLRHGDDFVRMVFEGESKDGSEPLIAIDTLLKTQGSSLADEYSLFGAWNVGTKDVASAGGYPDASKYPGTRTLALAEGATAITSGLSSFAYRGTLGAATQLQLDTDTARNAGVVVPFEGGVLQLGKAQKLPAKEAGEVLVVVSGVTTKKSDAPFTLRFADPQAPDAGAAPSTAPKDEGCTTAPAVPAFPLAGLLAVAGLVALRSRRRS